MYATWADDRWFANGLLGAGFSKYNNARVALNNSIARSDPSGTEFIANVSGGRDFKSNGWRLSPIAGLQYSHIEINSYAEDGAGAMNLTVSDQHIDSLRSKIGIQAARSVEWNDIVLTPRTQASWYHELLDGTHGVAETLSGAPELGEFDLNSTKRNKDLVAVGFGIAATPSGWDDDVTFFVNYSAQLATDYTANTVYGGVKIAF